MPSNEIKRELFDLSSSSNGEIRDIYNKLKFPGQSR
jgi:hypothetical protein